jgi:hypothetical protein
VRATTFTVVARTARGTVRETRTYRPCVRRAPRGR